MEITVQPRAKGTKGERRSRLRRGLIPASIYGKGLEPTLVEVSSKAVAEVLMSDTGLNTILSLTIEGKKAKHSVLIDNLERDPITRGFLNVGFHQVKRGDKVHAQIPVVLNGIPRDVQINGALLEQTLDSMDVTAEPSHLPVHIEVDVSGMKIGDVIRVADLPQDPKVTFTTHEEVAIVAVHVSTTAQQFEADEAAATVPDETPTGMDAVTEERVSDKPTSDSITGA
jgi:large subunit ribosomal protein L25